MSPKPTSKILLALDGPDGKEVEKKVSPVSETGKAPRQYVPLSFHPAATSGRLNLYGPSQATTI